MSELILSSDNTCQGPISTTIEIETATVITLASKATSPVVTIYYEGALIATLRNSNPEFTLTSIGQYTITLSASCMFARVYSSTAVCCISLHTWIQNLCYEGPSDDADPEVLGLASSNNRYDETGALIGPWSPSPGIDFFVSSVAQDPNTTLVYYFENPDGIGNMAICDWDTGGLLSDVPMSGITNTPLEFFTGAAYNPVTGEMWVKTNDDNNSPDDFYTVDLVTGVATYQFSHPNARIMATAQSGLAFDAAGNMYCDSGDDPDILVIIDTSTGLITQTITATDMFGTSAGIAFDFHPVTGQLHLLTSTSLRRVVLVYDIVGTTATQVDTYVLVSSGGNQLTFVSEPGVAPINFTRVYTRNADGDVTYTDYGADGSVIVIPDGTAISDCCCSPDEPVDGVAVTDFVTIASAGAGVVAAGFQKVTISNLGAGAATVHGNTLAVNQTITFEGYFDPVANEFKRLDEIPYDGSGGTTLSITTVL